MAHQFLVEMLDEKLGLLRLVPAGDTDPIQVPGVAPSAYIDTTNASNIKSGTLPDTVTTLLPGIIVETETTYTIVGNQNNTFFVFTQSDTVVNLPAPKQPDGWWCSITFFGTGSLSLSGNTWLLNNSFNVLNLPGGSGVIVYAKGGNYWTDNLPIGQGSQYQVAVYNESNAVSGSPHHTDNGITLIYDGPGGINLTGGSGAHFLNNGVQIGMPLYNSAGVAQSGQHMVSGEVSGTTTVTLSGAAAYSSATSYIVLVSCQTKNAAVSVQQTSGTQFTVTTSPSGVVNWIAVGN